MPAAMTVRALADAGHSVYAGMRDIAGKNAKQHKKPLTMPESTQWTCV